MSRATFAIVDKNGGKEKRKKAKDNIVGANRKDTSFTTKPTPIRYRLLIKAVSSHDHASWTTPDFQHLSKSSFPFQHYLLNVKYYIQLGMVVAPGSSPY